MGVPGPAPRALLRDSAPRAFSEALGVVGRPDIELATLGSGSNLSVRWRCSTCGHEWEAKPAARSKGRGCPECAWASRARSRAQAPAGRSVADLFPLIAAEFQSNPTEPIWGPGIFGMVPASAACGVAGSAAISGRRPSRTALPVVVARRVGTDGRRRHVGDRRDAQAQQLRPQRFHSRSSLRT